MPLWPRRTPAGDKESRKPNRPKDAEPGTGEERPLIPLPAETLEDTDVALHAERQLIQWVDEAVDDFARRGGFDNLPGKGKPLKVPEGDVLQTIMQNAQIPPPWVMLRREIGVAMEYAVELMDSGAGEQAVDDQLLLINRQILELNLMAPSLSLHRRKVSRDTIREQAAKWNEGG